jgi:class 3 adenylate cyclase/tetratricopeptide (TPR) repeat protein
LPAGERRQLTVLFCDLVGSTPLSQQLDAEEWRDVVEAYHRTAAAAVTRFGGYVAQYLGDGLLIYFGWPTARENDPERAIRAGLAILDAMGPLNATLAAGDGTRLAVRIGMHTGPVVIADSGAVFGDTANVAARVQGAAEPDTVVITAATQRLVGGMFVVEDRGPQMLKGVREPVTLYRVVQPSGVRSRFDVAAGRLTRFVDREIELAILVDRWERAQDGEGQNVVVLGEAGVGKSRLVYQLHEHLAAVPHTWLECGATPYTEGTPFHPIIALVAQGLAFAPEDTATEQLGKLEIGLDALASTETMALLADFLGLPSPAPLQMSPELQRRKTIDLLVQWTLSLSAAQPLVVCVEDLHWCDASTLELLGHVIAQSPTARVLLLAAARPEFTPPWPARSNLTTVQLARLTKRQARDMVAALGGPALPADTLDALVARADGVPLYVEELTKAVMEPGAARGVEAIPATLADSLMARLDRLSAAKEVAQRAAVLGREFGYTLLAAVAGMDEAALRHGLARLVEAEILFARGEPPAATYTFKHALIQETAYASLLKSRRRELHRRVAEVLVARFPENAGRQPELVAHHHTEAGDFEPAVAAWQRAAEQAFARSALREATAHYTSALAALASLPESAERDQRELLLQVALEGVLIMTKGYAAPETAQVNARARTLGARHGDPAQLLMVLMGHWVVTLTRGHLAAAQALADQVLESAERDARRPSLVFGHLAQGTTRVHRGDLLNARVHLEKAVGLHGPEEAFRVSVDPGVLAWTYAALATWQLGFADASRTRVREGVALARRLGRAQDVAAALTYGLLHHVLARDPQSVLEQVDELIQLGTDHELRNFLAFGLIWRGWALAEQGQCDEGIAQLRQGIEMLRAIHPHGLAVGYALGLLAEAYARSGGSAEARAVLEEGLTALSEEGTQKPALLHLRGALLARDGAPGAEASFREALALSRCRGARMYELRAATSLARLWRDQGKRTEARDLLAPLYAWFTEGFDTRDLQNAKALLDDLA